LFSFSEVEGDGDGETFANIEMTLCDVGIRAQSLRFEDNHDMSAVGDVAITLPGAQLAASSATRDHSANEFRLSMPTLDIDLPEVTAHASAEEIVVRGAVQARG
jgi:hypothetical protein